MTLDNDNCITINGMKIHITYPENPKYTKEEQQNRIFQVLISE